jgi:ribosomal protein S18 acetylase RimI-like enzyme
MTTIDIRSLSKEDYEALVRVWEEARLPYMPEGRDGPEEIARQIGIYPDLYIGAFDSDELVGVVIGNYDGRKGTINRLAVLPNYQRRGIATALVASCEKALRARGVEVISTLIETPNDSSVAFFKSIGYVHHEDIIYLSKRDRKEA